MSVSPEHQPLFPDVERPTIDVKIDENIYEFTWENTLIRRYSVGEGQYDHILHSRGEGNNLALMLTKEGAHELEILLEEKNFPTRTDPLPEADLIAWRAKMEAQSLQAELDAEFGS